jgi:PAS domain S-box-containing protein
MPKPSPPPSPGSRLLPRGVMTAAFVLMVAAIAACHVTVLGAARRALDTDPGGAYDALAWLVALDVALFFAALVVLWVRRQHESRRLRLAEVRFEIEIARARATFENALDPIVGFDSHGRIGAVNAAAAALFKLPSSEMTGLSVLRFLPCGRTTEGERFEPDSLETLVCSETTSADGSTVPVEFSLNRAMHGGEAMYTAVIRDVTARVKAEERVRAFAEGLEAANRQLEEANAQLEEASKLKSEFLANTSHELRTPLNGMIGFLQLVLDGMCDSTEEEREFLGQALECSRHLLGLINDVLDIAKIEAGKLTLEIEPVDVRAMFGEIYTLTHVQAAQKGLKLKFETTDPVAPRVRGDFGKVKQVLVNLVGNSIKFTSHGNVTVRASEHADLGHVTFEVIDTGIGIPPERQRMIFEKFTQGDGSTTRKYGGTGLGLAISKSLVELMGGVIDVETPESGTGTRIFFTLPLWRAEEVEEDVEDVEEHERDEAPLRDRIEGPVGGALVQIVEDDPVFTKYLVALLHRHGYRTVTASNAETAWVLVRRLKPNLVVLDYALTSAQGASLRTGWDLAERMSGNPRTRHVPLVFVTGFDVLLKDRLKGGALAQPPEHLLKPVEGTVLIQKIQDLIGARPGIVRVLMADDDPSVTAYVRKVLPQDRFHIEVANNGEECLHTLRMQPSGFDLLLLDLMMPDVSGYDVLRELALKRELQSLPVLILTNFPEARNEEEKRLLERGLVLDVIAKSSVHDNPQLLPHIIDWHLQVVRELGHEDGQAGTTAGQEAA